MSREPHNHLSPEELAWLVEGAEPAPLPPGFEFDRERAEDHASACRVCGLRLRSQRYVQVSLQKLANPVAGEPTSGCPADEKWTELAAGICSAPEASSLLEHATRCDYCGNLLRESTENLNPEISPQEQGFIRQLPSATAGWQRGLGRKMAEASRTEESKRTLVVRKSRRPARWPFAPLKRWALPVAVAAIGIIGVALWIRWSSPSLSAVNEKLAQAYSEQRPFQARFPGARYGPLREERGEAGPSRSRMDEPAELLEAEQEIAEALTRYPRDPGWRQVKARTDIFEGNYQSAIEELMKLQVDRPENTTIQFDLAIAYYGRARTQRDSVAKTTDFKLSLRCLDIVLSKNPNDAVGLFNRAVVHRELKQYSESNSDWQRYLQLDSTGPWADEAVRQKQDKD